MSDESKFVAIGPASAIEPGKFADFKLEGASILVVNCNGQYHAIEDRCTHDDGSLAEGRLYGCEIECPRHGAKFDMKTGKATALPAFNPVRSFPVRVTAEGQLEVDLNVAASSPRFEDPRGMFSF
jgi:3-phenylpropionate/trans-cinnamate dioxygenase ferredoxin component